ncbi:MAG: B12-binding domain-containing radical SAM protein [Candidatus Omnitrophica bacterium]|nr:B12-binding domain-containing radical SAM protein [Candidatus Omnitrophota bacterium]
MSKTILFIRPFKPVGLGGPVPPVDILYAVSALYEDDPLALNVHIIDMGIDSLTGDDVEQHLDNIDPDYLCLHALAWEAGLVHEWAATMKTRNKNAVVIVSGQLAMIAGRYLLMDPHINYAITGELDLIIPLVIKAIERQSGYERIAGLVYRDKGTVCWNSMDPRPAGFSVTKISPLAWDLIDAKSYSHYANWNGMLKRAYYLPIMTSRGCPYQCTYCRENYSNRFFAREPDDVLAEMVNLKEKYAVREFHVFDAVFNFDMQRAKEICQRIIDANLNVSLSFPHGLRVDKMDEELIQLLKLAGTYKLVYGIETAVGRLQKEINKNLDLSAARDIIFKTSQSGIITGGYFMLGFPSETEEEMLKTIDFAVHSELDTASFFKFTAYDDILKIYQSKSQNLSDDRKIDFEFKDVSYYSSKGSHSDVSAGRLNHLMLMAQQRFYLNGGRFLKCLKKYPSKGRFLKNYIQAISLMLQGYLFLQLKKEQG